MGGSVNAHIFLLDIAEFPYTGKVPYYIPPTMYPQQRVLLSFWKKKFFFPNLMVKKMPIKVLERKGEG